MNLPSEDMNLPSEDMNLPAEDRNLTSKDKNLPSKGKKLPLEDKKLASKDKKLPSEDKKFPKDMTPSVSSQGSMKSQEKMKVSQNCEQLSKENKKLSKKNRLLSQESVQLVEINMMLSHENSKLKEQMATMSPEAVVEVPVVDVAEQTDVEQESSTAKRTGRVMVSGGGKLGRRTGETWIVDAGKMEWTRVADCLTSCPSLCNFENTVIASGGWKIDGPGTSNMVSSYDPKTNTWIELPSMSQPRHSHAAVNHENKSLFSIGGDCSGRTAEVYSADSRTWRKVPVAPIELRQVRAILVKHTSSILCFDTLWGKDRTAAAQFSILTDQWSRIELTEIPRSPYINFIQQYDVEICPALFIEHLGDLVGQGAHVISSAPKCILGWQSAAMLRNCSIAAMCNGSDLCIYQKDAHGTWLWMNMGSKGELYSSAVLEI